MTRSAGAPVESRNCSTSCAAPIIALISAVTAAAGGCATKPGPVTVQIAPGEYPRAFQAAKDALREFQFELDRVDASSGILTTHPRPSSGLATPWIPHTSTFADAWEGLVERERRTAAVHFQPPETAAPAGTTQEAPAEPAVPPQDLPGYSEFVDPLANPAGPLMATVDVRVARVYRPGKRVDSTGVRLTTFSSDPEMVEQRLEPAFPTDVRSDATLASRLAARISELLHKPVPAGTRPSAPETIQTPSDEQGTPTK